MGYYLGVSVVYGVAWDDPPEQIWTVGDVEEGRAVYGDAVYGDRLRWATHGYFENPGWHLEVCEAPGSESQGAYAERIPWEEPDAEHVIKWDAWIIDYLMKLDVPPGRIPAPGWLALASWG
jgi:hypothetical protein